MFLLSCCHLQAKAIVVPTDDSEVKVRLRDLGEPTCEDYLSGVWPHRVVVFRPVWGRPC